MFFNYNLCCSLGSIIPLRFNFLTFIFFFFVYGKYPNLVGHVPPINGYLALSQFGALISMSNDECRCDFILSLDNKKQIEGEGR